MSSSTSHFKLFCGVFSSFCIVAGILASFAIVCTSSQATVLGCPFTNQSATSGADVTSPGDDSLKTEVILRAVFAGVSVAWLGLVMAICLWYNIVRYRRRYKVSIIDSSAVPTRAMEYVKAPSQMAQTAPNQQDAAAGDQAEARLIS